MGRPLNKKYFANTNYQDFGSANVGGEGVASVAIAATIVGTYDGTVTATFSAPQIAGGVAATGTVTVDENFDITGIVVTNSGSGYTSAPTISIVSGTDAVLLTSGSGGVTVTMTTTRQNGIKCEAQIGAGSELTTGDVVEQVSARRYRVRTSDGVAVCKLVTTADLDANQMSITATDSAGGTYFVKKLTARKAVLVQGTGTQFATGATAKWTFGAAVLNTTVSIQNQ